MRNQVYVVQRSRVCGVKEGFGVKVWGGGILCPGFGVNALKDLRV